MIDPNENRPGYKKTTVGWIPEEWAAPNLGKLLSFKNGLNKGREAFGSGMPIVNYTDVYNKPSFNQEALMGRVTVTKNELKNHKVHSGDVFFTRTSETPQDIGLSAVALGEYADVVFSGFLLRGRPISKHLFDGFSAYCFSSYAIRKEIIRKSSYTTRALTNGRFLSEAIIPLPPLPEQKKIADILSTWDRAIDKTRDLIAAKRKQKKGLMQQLLTPRSAGQAVPQRRLPGFEGEWAYLKAGDLFKRVSEKSAEVMDILSVTQDNGVVLRSDVGKDIAYAEKNVGTYKIVRPGDFIISLRSFQGGLELSTITGKVSPAYHVIRGSDQTHSDFYRHYFKSYEFINRLDIAVIGIRDGKQVSFDDFAFLKTPNPSLKEQTAITRVLDTADREIQILESKLAALERQTKGLMQRLLTGQIRVKLS
jgi:type I restriction enzyme S subunit